VGVQNKAGINLKIPQPSKQCPVKKHLARLDQQEEKSIRSVCADVEENNKRYQENHSYTEHDKN
jgi:hypothetical protein